MNNSATQIVTYLLLPSPFLYNRTVPGICETTSIPGSRSVTQGLVLNSQKQHFCCSLLLFLMLMIVFMPLIYAGEEPEVLQLQGASSHKLYIHQGGHSRALIVVSILKDQ